MVDSGVLALVFLAIVLGLPLHDLQYGPQAAFISESFPGSNRYSGASLGYQLASLTAGGPAPQIALALLLVLFAHAAGAQVLVGRVTKVVDGDTIDVAIDSGPIRVRLHGIDTPERGQPWGTEATEWLRTRVQGKDVELEPINTRRLPQVRSLGLS